MLYILTLDPYKKTDLLKSFLNCLPKAPEVISITETSLQKNTEDLYFLEGYGSLHLRRSDREHGGITCFTKNK